MHRTFSKLAIVGVVFVVIAGLSIVISGQQTLRPSTGVPQDWSHSHLIFANPGSFAQAVRNGSVAQWYKIMNDPRYQIQQQLRRNAATVRPNAVGLKKPVPPKPAPPKSTPLAKDWNFSLDTTGAFTAVAASRWPAKYSFSEVASCANDFVIYGLDTQGYYYQANLIGVNNLYVGAAAGGGCEKITNNGGNGTFPTPEVKWAFNVAPYPITTSVVLSEDGTKIAFVVNTTYGVGPPVLHVLTLGSGTNGNTNCGGTGTSQCSVDAPGAPNSTYSTGSSDATVTLSSSTQDDNSEVYVDYSADTGYLGDANGHLYKVTGMFNGTPTIAPGWPKSLAGSSVNLCAPVYDSVTDTVFIGGIDGNLYGVNATTGVQITGSPLTLATGNGISYGLLAFPPRRGFHQPRSL
jgi:hypothetical protein